MGRIFGTALLALALAAALPAGDARGEGLVVRRIGLSFTGGGAETTVTRGAPVPPPLADLAFSGSGLLQGHWEVDGRTVATVAQHLAGPGPVTLRLPESATLPSFDPGAHVVRLVLAAPAPAPPTPSLLYFVLPEGAGGQRRELKPLEPDDGLHCTFGTLAFSWAAIPGDPVYLVQFLEEPGGKPLFSAYTREEGYTLPEPVARGLFAPGGKYWWRVTGYDAASRVVGASPPWCFVITKGAGG